MKSYPSHRLWTFLILAGSGLLVDLCSKSWVFSSIGYPYTHSLWTKEWFGGALQFRLTTSFNEGALWGVGQGFSLGFAALSILAGTFIVYWLFFRGEAHSLWLTISLALIMAGTLGNLYDRLHLHGCAREDGSPYLGVRDFLDFRIGTYDYPIFNFADSFLVTGAIMLTIQSFRVPSRESEALAATQPAATTPDSTPSAMAISS
ncbi:MAG: signal peptidase II [Planctomycetales bacterium]|nr:signal peptidase II [Planctomycetales bacterium]